MKVSLSQNWMPFDVINKTTIRLLLTMITLENKEGRGWHKKSNLTNRRKNKAALVKKPLCLEALSERKLRLGYFSENSCLHSSMNQEKVESRARFY